MFCCHPHMTRKSPLFINSAVADQIRRDDSGEQRSDGHRCETIIIKKKKKNPHELRCLCPAALRRLAVAVFLGDPVLHFRPPALKSLYSVAGERLTCSSRVCVPHAVKSNSRATARVQFAPCADAVKPLRTELPDAESGVFFSLDAFTHDMVPIYADAFYD